MHQAGRTRAARAARHYRELRAQLRINDQERLRMPRRSRAQNYIPAELDDLLVLQYTGRTIERFDCERFPLGSASGRLTSEHESLSTDVGHAQDLTSNALAAYHRAGERVDDIEFEHGLTLKYDLAIHGSLQHQLTRKEDSRSVDQVPEARARHTVLVDPRANHVIGRRFDIDEPGGIRPRDAPRQQVDNAVAENQVSVPGNSQLQVQR